VATPKSGLWAALTDIQDARGGVMHCDGLWVLPWGKIMFVILALNFTTLTQLQNARGLHSPSWIAAGLLACWVVWLCSAIDTLDMYTKPIVSTDGFF
jgi:hypothetical protein